MKRRRSCGFRGARTRCCAFTAAGSNLPQDSCALATQSQRLDPLSCGLSARSISQTPCLHARLRSSLTVLKWVIG
jgi:hypothetical protein